MDHSSFGSLGNITLPAQYSGCAECHDGGVATGKSTGHLQTTADCGACHDPQRSNWFGAGFDHSGVSIVGNTSNPTCTSCHDGATATGQSVTHVPLPTAGQDCLACHDDTAFTSFALPTFDHAAAGITNNCGSCHDGKAHDGVLVIKRPAAHIPTSADCSTCHADTTNGPGVNGTVTSGFANADPFVNTVHPAYTTGCRTCHNGSYDNAIYSARGHPSDSVHTTVDANGWDCNACHSTTGSFLETNPVNHQDPAVRAQPCVSCHVAGNTTGAIGKGPTHPANFGYLSAVPSGGRHVYGGLRPHDIEHRRHQPRIGVFELSRRSDRGRETGQPRADIARLRQLSRGVSANGIVVCRRHIQSHRSRMTGRQCMQCHNDSIAVGKTSFGTFTHIATNSDCGARHSTTTFANATAFNHTGVTTGCAASGCHMSGTPSVADVTDDPNSLPHIPIVNGSTEVNCLQLP